MAPNSSKSGLPVVTIVTPAYNQAGFLRDTIESVLSQDYPNIEYLVLNDGSTDETEEILKEYNGRVRWETQKNQGQTNTIINGWKKTTGDIVTWLNSDDTLLEGAVSEAVQYLQEHPGVDIVFGDTLYTHADGTAVAPSPNRNGFTWEKFVLECENQIPQPSAFIRRKVVEDVGTLVGSFFYLMDWEFFLRAGIEHRFEYLPRTWSTYRLHSQSNTVSKATTVAPKELEQAYELFFGRKDVPEGIRMRKRYAMANMRFTQAGYYMRGNLNGLARQAAWKAVAEYPELLLNPAQIRKFLFCLLGNSAPYRMLRKARYQGVPQTDMQKISAAISH